MSDLIVDKLTVKELEAAREALVSLYEAKEEYATAKAHLHSVEMRMARLYDTVNYFFKHIKQNKGGEK